MLQHKGFAVALALGMALLAGCQHDKSTTKDTSTTRVETTTQSTDSRMGNEHRMMAAAGGGATATIEPSKAPGQDNVRGVVHFMPATGGKGVMVHAVINGLDPNTKHGFHIHDKGDLSAPDLMSAGGHYNPTGHKHGGPESAERHGGDLGNLTADASGKANYEATIPDITIDGIVGKSVIVHEKPDDLKTDPSGASGARIAGGVINKGGDSANR